jgi:hypothetical protein
MERLLEQLAEDRRRRLQRPTPTPQPQPAPTPMRVATAGQAETVSDLPIIAVLDGDHLSSCFHFSDFDDSASVGKSCTWP